MSTVQPTHIEMLKAASDAMHELVDEIEALQKDLAIAKAATAPKVELEKVASPVKTISPEKAAEFAAYLADHAFITEGSREKYAAACVEDPNNLADIAMQVLKVSEPPASQGYGIKTANAPLTDEDIALAEERELWMSL